MQFVLYIFHIEYLIFEAGLMLLLNGQLCTHAFIVLTFGADLSLLFVDPLSCLPFEPTQNIIFHLEYY